MIVFEKSLFLNKVSFTGTWSLDFSILFWDIFQLIVGNRDVFPKDVILILILKGRIGTVGKKNKQTNIKQINKNRGRQFWEEIKTLTGTDEKKLMCV